jgi:hypothetical protein
MERTLTESAALAGALPRASATQRQWFLTVSSLETEWGAEFMALFFLALFPWFLTLGPWPQLTKVTTMVWGEGKAVHHEAFQGPQILLSYSICCNVK